MIDHGRKRWLTVASLFLTLFAVFGAIESLGVFFTPLLKQFGWTRARLSTLNTGLALATGISSPLAGWLLDRIQARYVMAAGLIMSAAGLALASQTQSYHALLAAYMMLGFGAGAATLTPCALVVANWFEEGRGLAMGITIAGTSSGGMVLTVLADRGIAAGGWRAGYATLPIPMIVIALPLVLAVVRNHPAASSPSIRPALQTGPRPSFAGLEFGDAVRGRSFWLLCFARFASSLALAGLLVHLVPYLIDLGYHPGNAAAVQSASLGLATLGKPTLGLFADRSSARRTLSLDLLVIAIGVLLLLGAQSTPILISFILIFGVSFGAPLSLVPLTMAETVGRKRLGLLLGFEVGFGTLGAALGPLIAGRVFDLRANYAHAFELFALALALGAVGAWACVPFEEIEPELLVGTA